MKIRLATILTALFLLLLLNFTLLACASNSGKQENKSVPEAELENKQEKTGQLQAAKLRLIIEGQEVIIRLHDNPTSRDLLTLLPLTLTFKDYAGVEKIGYLPRKLATQGFEASEQMRDDFAYFAPWGNLAMFYQGKHQGGKGLIILGEIESGKDILAQLKTDFSLTIEQITY